LQRQALTQEHLVVDVATDEDLQHLLIRITTELQCVLLAEIRHVRRRLRNPVHTRLPLMCPAHPEQDQPQDQKVDQGLADQGEKQRPAQSFTCRVASVEAALVIILSLFFATTTPSMRSVDL